MSIFSCDYEGCERKPYVECYEIGGNENREDGEPGKWWWVCFWHYVWIRILILFRRQDKIGFAKVDTDRESIEHLHQELWDIQGDLTLVKEKLKIKEPKVYEPEKEEEKGFA